MNDPHLAKYLMQSTDLENSASLPELGNHLTVEQEGSMYRTLNFKNLTEAINLDPDFSDATVARNLEDMALEAKKSEINEDEKHFVGNLRQLHQFNQTLKMHNTKDLLNKSDIEKKSLAGDESSELLNDFYLEHMQRVNEET